MERLSYEQRAKLETAERAANSDGPTGTGAIDIAHYRTSALVYIYQSPEILEALYIHLTKLEMDITFMSARPLQYPVENTNLLKKEYRTIKEQIYGVYSRLETYKQFLELTQ